MILTAVNNIGQAGLIAVLGWGVVFLGLTLLLLVVAAIGLAFRQKKTVKTDVPAPAAAAPEKEENKPLAPGSAGQLKLHNVEPRTAAMLMAIVADKMGKPLNELHFISIKEVQ